MNIFSFSNNLSKTFIRTPLLINFKHSVDKDVSDSRFGTQPTDKE